MFLKPGVNTEPKPSHTPPFDNSSSSRRAIQTPNRRHTPRTRLFQEKNKNKMGWMRKKPLREGKFSTFTTFPDDLIFQEFGRLLKYDCIHPQWLFLVPEKGGLGGIVHPPIGRKTTTYIALVVLAFWGVICYLPPFTGTWKIHWQDERKDPMTSHEILRGKLSLKKIKLNPKNQLEPLQQKKERCLNLFV